MKILNWIIHFLKMERLKRDYIFFSTYKIDRLFYSRKQFIDNMSSTSTSTSLSPNDPLYWRQPTPVDCTTIRIIGVFLCIAASAGIVLNGSLFSSFIRYKELRTPPNIFIMFISGIGLGASIIILPSTGFSSIFCFLVIRSWRMSIGSSGGISLWLFKYLSTLHC